MTRRLVPSLVLALALAACDFGSGGRPPIMTPTKKPASPKVAGASASPGLGGPVITPAKAGIVLAGVAKIISDHGGGIISDHGGGIISDHGGGIISNNTGGLVSDKGGGYRLAQTAQLAEFLLADAVVTLQDAAGKPILGPDGKPLTATTDQSGRYELKAELPATSLVARIQLKQGGELAAMLGRDALAAGAAAAGPVPLDLDTATSVGAAYVLDQYVKGQQAVFDRLPDAESDKLTRAINDARDAIAKKPDYTATALVGLATELRGKAPAVDKSFEDIKILLLGQADIGAGRPATEVSLGRPRALALTADAQLLIGEGDGFLGRVRRVDQAGVMHTLADAQFGEVKINFPQVQDMAVGPDGSVWVAEGATGRVYRLKPDGTSEHVAGNGVNAAGDVDVPADLAPLFANRIDVAPDGTLYIGTGDKDLSPGHGEPRLLYVGADRVVHRVPIAPKWVDGSIEGLALRPDGDFDVLHRPYDGKFKGTYYRVKQDGSWTIVAKDVPVGRSTDLARGPQDAVYIIEQAEKRISAYSQLGTATAIAGKGAPAGSELVQPSSVAVGADGTLYIADDGTGLVHSLTRAGAWKTLAGRAAGAQRGEYDAIAISAPGGVAFDAQGRLLYADGGTHTVRRLDKDELTVVAGSTRGREGDGGPATAAQLDGPRAIAFKGAELWILDAGNGRLRKVGADGTISSVIGSQAGGSLDDLEVGETKAPDKIRVKSGVDFTFDKDGYPLWTDVDRRQIMRLRADGQVEQLAGKPEPKALFFTWPGDGLKPTEVSLDLPTAVLFDKAGDLLIADPLALAIRKLTGYGTPDAKLVTFAGASVAESISRLGADPNRNEEGVDLADATLLGPAGMCYDAAGNLYVAEVGTSKAGVLAATLTGKQAIDPSFLPPSPPRIRKITPDGKIFTVAGPGGKLLTDPDAADALVSPWRLAIDPEGRMVVVDIGANQLRFFPKGSY